MSIGHGIPYALPSSLDEQCRGVSFIVMKAVYHVDHFVVILFQLMLASFDLLQLHRHDVDLLR